MATILALDLSTKSGYAVLSQEVGGPIKLHFYGTFCAPPESTTKAYPFNFMDRAGLIAYQAWHTMLRIHSRLGLTPDFFVIEETNIGRSRYSQKMLEFIHCAVLSRLSEDGLLADRFRYINTSDWRKLLGVILSAEQKKTNARLSKAKSAAKKAGKKLDKKALGINGKINKKHVAINTVNQLFGLDFKPKDNDMADAICLGVAYFKGVKTCDGK
jgi:hypothetical protein